MANHKSAEKRARQERVRRVRNRGIKSAVRSAIKEVRTALASGDASAAGERLRAAEQSLRKAVSRGVIPAERASRTVSRLSKQHHALSK